mmetsp:Transcript_50739/g.145618  ORF Transcript_50739/g.145618 Transcript_50739/m.145618 type:complete len:240 (+) Transcript_50739:871-1590(+)
MGYARSALLREVDNVYGCGGLDRCGLGLVVPLRRLQRPHRGGHQLWRLHTTRRTPAAPVALGANAGLARCRQHRHRRRQPDPGHARLRLAAPFGRPFGAHEEEHPERDLLDDIEYHCRKQSADPGGDQQPVDPAHRPPACDGRLRHQKGSGVGHQQRHGWRQRAAHRVLGGVRLHKTHVRPPHGSRQQVGRSCAGRPREHPPGRKAKAAGEFFAGQPRRGHCGAGGRLEPDRSSAGRSQ